MIFEKKAKAKVSRHVLIDKLLYMLAKLSIIDKVEMYSDEWFSIQMGIYRYFRS